MFWFVFGVALLLGVLTAMHLYTKLDARMMDRVLRWSGGLLLTVLALFLAMRGRFWMAAPVAIAAYFVFMYLSPWTGRGRTEGDGAREGSPNRSSAGGAGTDARIENGPAGPAMRPDMPPRRPRTREEAFAFLGLKENATDAEIRWAHRTLMKRYHPDQGGSAEMASCLNTAKEILLGR